MKRLGTLVMAVILITGCNAMQPNMEETELLWRETEKNIQKWARTTKADAIPAEKPRSTPVSTVETPQKTPTATKSTEEPTPEPPTVTHQLHLNRKSPSNLNRPHPRKQNNPRKVQ